MNVNIVLIGVPRVILVAAICSLSYHPERGGGRKRNLCFSWKALV